MGDVHLLELVTWQW